MSLCCRLKDTCGSLSRVLLYIAYFAPTTINTAWLSVAAGVGVLIMPQVRFPWHLTFHSPAFNQAVPSSSFRSPFMI